MLNEASDNRKNFPMSLDSHLQLSVVHVRIVVVCEQHDTFESQFLSAVKIREFQWGLYFKDTARTQGYRHFDTFGGHVSTLAQILTSWKTCWNKTTKRH